MRFMMFMYPVISDEEWTPSVEAVAAMSKYNEELTKAGVLLALDGLRPASEGARISRPEPGGPVKVLDGPFSEAKEVVGGYWILQCKSREEAIEWASRCPLGGPSFVEVRPIFEMSDFPPELQEAASLSETPPQQTVA
jgi:hypothetical protein